MIEQFRAKGGRGVEGFGDRLLLLTTRGARSGAERTTPLAYTKDGERLVVIASKGGAPTHPAWYHNVRVNPVVTVEVGDQRFAARAQVTEGEERERLYDQMAAIMPGFNEYRRKTSRVIPVI